MPKTYTTGDVAAKFNTTTKTVRRHMRANGIRCGSGARHSWNAKQFNAVVKKLKENTKLTEVETKPRTVATNKPDSND